MDILQSIGGSGTLPSSVVMNMAKAMGEAIAAEERKRAASDLRGPYYAGGVASGVNVCTPVKSAGGASVNINFKGSQHGNRLGEIAFINEYGKKSQPARTFIDNANKSAEEKAVKAAENILDAYLASLGF